MKKTKSFIFLIIVVVLGFGIWYTVHIHSSATVTPPIKIAPATTHPDPSNATFQFSDGPVTLKNGTAITDITPNGELTQETDLTKYMAYGDLNGDGKTDVAFLLVQQSNSGTGVFLNVAAYVSGLVQYQGTNAIFLGDNVIPKSIAMSNGIITVMYLDRTANEAMTDAPTVLTTKTFAYINGELVEK